MKTIGYAAQHSFSNLKPVTFERDEPKAHEVEIEVLFCGVCHSDVHQVKNEWSNTVYPCMPGHEIVGRVARVGGGVTRHQVGDLVGVGCMVDSCRSCDACAAGDQNYCEGPNSWLATYNGPMLPAKKADTGTNMYGRDNTFGGYSSAIVVPEDFVLKIPAALKPEGRRPDPLRRGDDLLAAEALGREGRQPGWDHRLRRAGRHGDQASRGDGRGGDHVHAHGGKARGRPAAGCDRRAGKKTRTHSRRWSVTSTSC